MKQRRGSPARRRHREYDQPPWCEYAHRESRPELDNGRRHRLGDAVQRLRELVVHASARETDQSQAEDREQDEGQQRHPSAQAFKRHGFEDSDCQNKPTVSPDSSMSIAKAAGAFPSPGIVIISPHSATIQPAPV